MGLINVEVNGFENLKYNKEENKFYLISSKINYHNVQLKFIVEHCDSVIIDDKQIDTNDFITLDISKPLEVIVKNSKENKKYIIEGLDINLPTISINTNFNNQVIKEEWLSSSIKIMDENHNIIVDDNINIKGRGNYSWTFAKVSYTIKFDNPISLLGMSSDKKWCLLSMNADDSLLKTDIAFYISKQTNLLYTPRGRFVELILNGKELGLYYLCEKIKVSENKLNINKFDINDLDNSGFLFYVKPNNGKKEIIYHSKLGFRYILKYPKINDDNREKITEYISNKISTLEDLLENDETTLEKISEIIDIDSFIEFLLLIEIIEHSDILPRYASVINNLYIYINNGKFYLGPLWDVDNWVFINSNKFITHKSSYHSGMYEFFKSHNVKVTEYLFYNDFLYQRKDFIQLFIERWKVLKDKYKDINSYIDNLYDKLKIAFEHNYNIWKDFNKSKVFTQPPMNLSFDECANKLKEIINSRMKWLDENINDLLNYCKN
jgi:hypothetical protein